MTIHSFRTAALAGIIAAAIAAPAFALDGQLPSTVPSQETMAMPEQTMPPQQNAAQPAYVSPETVAQGTYSALPAPVNDGMRYQQQEQQAGLQPQQEGDVTFITGGIGDSEVDQLKSQANHYNFQMINSDPTGHYTANTDLVIQSKDGREMIRVNDAGPLFYAQLPPGVYTLEATHDGRSETKTIRIAAHGEPAKAVMIWR